MIPTEADSPMQDLQQRLGGIVLDAMSPEMASGYEEEVSQAMFDAGVSPSQWSPPINEHSSVEHFRLDNDHNAPTTTTTALTNDDYDTQHTAIGTSLFLPWWEEKSADDHFLVRTSMTARGGEGLLVDPGSPDNLVGSGWSKRMASLMTSAGGPAPFYAPHYLEVGGAGQGAQVARTKVTHHIVCPTIDKAGGPGVPVAGTFEAPEIESEKVPALLGLKTLVRMKAIMDMGQNRLIVPGPGAVQMHFPAGTTVYPLEPTHSGNLLLPCSELDHGRPSEERITLLSGVTAAEGTEVAKTQTTQMPRQKAKR